MNVASGFDFMNNYAYGTRMLLSDHLSRKTDEQSRIPW